MNQELIGALNELEKERASPKKFLLKRLKLRLSPPISAISV